MRLRDDQGASATALALAPVPERRPHEQPVLPNAFTGEHLEPRAPSTFLAARPMPFVPLSRLGLRLVGSSPLGGNSHVMAPDNEPTAPLGLTRRGFRVLASAGALLFASVGAHVAMRGLGPGGASGSARQESERLAQQLRLAQGDVELLRIRTQRLDSVFLYSARYKVPADLAALIYDVALWVGLDPHLGFRLVNAESGFEARAVSSAGAVGLAQLMPNTAQALMPGITIEQLFEPETNLRLGFGLLRQLITRYDGDLGIALVDYNGGPRKVLEFLRVGAPDTLAYVRAVMGRR